jgi:hypothetical protein
MPKLICVTLLDFTLRPGKNFDFHQVVDCVYRQKPHQLATGHQVIHHLQLPVFLKKEAKRPDFNNPLHCWLLAIVESHRQGKRMDEVIEMRPELEEFRKRDKGFDQFAARHGLVTSDPKVRQKYDLWAINDIIMAEEFYRREAKGKAETMMEISLKRLRRAKSNADRRSAIKDMRELDIPDVTIKEARKRIKAENAAETKPR